MRHLDPSRAGWRGVVVVGLSAISARCRVRPERLSAFKRPAPTTCRTLLLCGDRSHGPVELPEQFGERSHLLGLPVTHKQREPLEAELFEAAQLVASSWLECHQARTSVSRIGGDLHVPRVLQLANLSGHERWVNLLEIGDLGGRTATWPEITWSKLKVLAPFRWRRARSIPAFMVNSAATIDWTSRLLGGTR